MSNAQYETDLELAAAAESFLSSRLARHIFDSAAEVVDECTVALIATDPENVKEVRRLQEEIRRQSTLGLWLKEIVNKGVEAKNMLAGEEG